VAYPLAVRGREDGAELEMGDEGTYNALRAGDGGSSRQSLVAYSTKLHNTKSNQAGKFYEEYTPSLQHNSPPPAVISGESEQEPFTFDWQAGGSGDTSFRGKSRQWIEDPPGRTRALVANKTPAVAVSENQRGEVLETDYARQMTAGGGKPGQGYPAVRDGLQVRRLLPVECERLQAFDDDWTAVGTDSARYKQMGNAVTVNVVAWIAHRLVVIHEST
jgi:site-specific DNA-cytosine methylase